MALSLTLAVSFASVTASLAQGAQRGHSRASAAPSPSATATAADPTAGTTNSAVAPTAAATSAAPSPTTASAGATTTTARRHGAHAGHGGHAGHGRHAGHGGHAGHGRHAGHGGHASRPTGTPQPTQTPDQGQPDEQPSGAANPNCTLTVPANPLSAKGLASPYLLSGGDGGACHESNPDQSAFVEATILDSATGKLAVYHPLVVDEGTEPAVAPVVPDLAASSVVGIWFGFNGDRLTLRDTNGSLAQGSCVNGLGGSLFGQFAYCNAGAFFTAARAAIGNNRLIVPPLGTGRDGKTCPTVRDFGVVDQDQSDNVTTTYLVTADGRTAQDTAAASAQLAQATRLTNGSDNGLLDGFIDPALGCTPFMAPDLTDPGTRSPALALNELQASAHQPAPVALVPLNNPMTLVDGQQSVAKTNLYRVGVGQPPVALGTDTPQAYCTSIETTGRERLAAERDLFAQAASPDPATANLYEFLAQRLDGSISQLGCDETAAGHR